MKKVSVLLLLVGIVGSAAAQKKVNNVSTLSIDQIMKGEDFVGYWPRDISWSEDSKTIYFDWNPEQDTLSNTYSVDINTNEIHKLNTTALKNQVPGGSYSSDYRYKVYEKHGDIYVLDLRNESTKRVTFTYNRESNPKFARNDEYIVYESENNLFSWSIKTGQIEQLTRFQSGSQHESSKTAQEKWLNRDEMVYIKTLKERKAEGDLRQKRNEELSPKWPKEISIGDKSISDLTFSPDLHYVVYRLIKTADTKGTMVPDYVTQSGYTEERNARAKVGSPRATYESWIYDRSRDTTYLINVNEIPGIYDKPAYLKEYAADKGTYKDKYEEPREVFFGSPVFSDDGKAVINVSARDYKDRWIMRLDLNTGELKLLDRQHDDAWIAGEDIGWFSRGTLEWIDNEHIWFKSEATGYAHLYTVNVNTGKIKALTSGKFEVSNVQLSRDKKTFYITSNKESPHEQHFYHLSVAGGKMEKITDEKGGYRVTVSPDEKHLAVRYSFSNKPWELYIMDNRPGASMQQVTQSTTEAFNSYHWRVPEIVQFTARDGNKVPASLYKPDPEKKNGAAIIFVHGAGYLQNVHYWWPAYYREYMFNNLLADNGYTVLAIDFRASAGYGRDWRTAIYRHMGGKDLDDQIDGAQYLIDEYDIDPDRIGMYGGSYGGFITLMALFKYPDTFKSGAALRSVTDWAHYNHGYTANILNTPAQDSIAYARSSPIYYAEGLKGNLLMLHGMIDTNVHFQDVVRLSQRLIELGKDNWELAVFPLESHGFREASSWTDEYKRIYKLFQETLQKE